MCGICGIIAFDRDAVVPDPKTVQRMTALLSRRGPDDESFWVDATGRIQLGFRRLSVIDPTIDGRQPMVAGNGRSVIVFNGEVYNFPELREELIAKGIRFRSRTDSEVVLEALEQWGIAALTRFNGMFALAWYSIADRLLLLARDHAGIKPLYYSIDRSSARVAFASQLDALLEAPWLDGSSVRADVLRLYFRLHHVPPPYGLVQQTEQLEPGQYVVLGGRGVVERRNWWSLPRHPEPELRGGHADEALSEAVDNAVRRQRIADVPLGVFLSGGIDSPLVTAIARRQTSSDLKAFTIGNPGWWQDEAEAASAYARHLGVDHRLHHAHDDDAQRIISDVMRAQHEPFADFSILPTLLVSHLARGEVTVALSGDGGDELFFGYERPFSLLRNGSDFAWPRPVRIASYLAWKYILRSARSDVIVNRSPGHYYFDVNSRLKDDVLRRLAPGLPSIPEDFALYDFDRYRGKKDLANYSRWVEFYGQLQRGLKKVDMASMFHSLEVRVPLLDREVLDVSLRIDPFDSMRGNRRKGILRDLLACYVPPNLIPTPKRGFAVPLGAWLRSALRPMVETTLLDSPLFPDGVFDRREVERYWNEHSSGARDHKWGLWTILALQWWGQTHGVNADIRDTDGGHAQHEPAAAGEFGASASNS